MKTWGKTWRLTWSKRHGNATLKHDNIFEYQRDPSYIKYSTTIYNNHDKIKRFCRKLSIGKLPHCALIHFFRHLCFHPFPSEKDVPKKKTSGPHWNTTSWWFQPIWKICSSNWIISPATSRDENKKYLSCHHLDQDSCLLHISDHEAPERTVVSMNPLTVGSDNFPDEDFLLVKVLLRKQTLIVIRLWFLWRYSATIRKIYQNIDIIPLPPKKVAVIWLYAYMICLDMILNAGCLPKNLFNCGHPWK